MYEIHLSKMVRVPRNDLKTQLQVGRDVPMILESRYVLYYILSRKVPRISSLLSILVERRVSSPYIFGQSFAVRGDPGDVGRERTCWGVSKFLIGDGQGASFGRRAKVYCTI